MHDGPDHLLTWRTSKTGEGPHCNLLLKGLAAMTAQCRSVYLPCARQDGVDAFACSKVSDMHTVTCEFWDKQGSVFHIVHLSLQSLL